MGQAKEKKTVSLETDKSPARRSERKRKKSMKYNEGEFSTEAKKPKHKNITPEKLPVPPSTPRKSRQSKVMSPLPITKYHQNRMPEQTILGKEDGESFYIVLWCLTL